MWIVIIEARGVKPSSTYYSRRAKLGLSVRPADVKHTPVADRVASTPGIIVQEGCIVTPSESQAMAVASLALDEGLHDVFVGKLPELVPLEHWDYDLGKIAAHLKETLGARGRKPPSQAFAVTCFECLHTETQDVPYPVKCELCGSLNFKSRAGHAPTIYETSAVSRGDILDYWLRTRFATGWFEIPEIVRDDTAWETVPVEERVDVPEKANLAFIDPDEEQTFEQIIRNSPLATLLRWALKNLPDVGQVWAPHLFCAHMLDAAFCARAYRGRGARKAARIEMIITVGLAHKLALPLQEEAQAAASDVALYTDKDTQAFFGKIIAAYQEANGGKL